MNLWRPKYRTSASILLLLWGAVFSATVLWSVTRAVPAMASGKEVQDPATTATELASEAAAGGTPAQAPPTAENIAAAQRTIRQNVLTPYLKMALLSLVVNLFEYVLNRLAYDAAVALASGGKAQGTLFTSDSAGEAWKTFGLDVAGEAIGTLSQTMNETEWAKNIGLSFDVCAPNVDIAFGLQLGIKGMYQKPEPECSWSEIATNWEGFYTKMQDKVNPSEETLKAVAKGYLTGDNSLSASASIMIGTYSKALEEKQTNFAKMLADNGFKDVGDVITGQVKTPSSVLKTQFEYRLLEAQTTPETQMGVASQNSELLTGFLTSVSSTFFNTLLSQLIKNIYSGYFAPTPLIDPFDELSADIPGREEAEARFSQLLRTQPVVIPSYNVLSDFVVCTASSGISRQSNNCVMDANFVAAVVRSDTEPGGMTVAEAIEQGLLNGASPLISSEDLTRNQDPYCYTYGYCYGNLVKMRKARIIPIGWELAASSPANSEASPVTLQKVIDGFDDCDSDGKLSEAHPWCHLIDPNWVLKYPQSQCQAQVNGEILISQFSAGRGSTCVDAPSCIAEDEDGQCVGGYGYCTREQNVWRFRGDECPEQYATCLSFAKTSTGETGDFLLNTVNFNGCTSANAGCMWYRTNKYFDDLGTSTDVTDDVYNWLPTGETYLAPVRDDDLFHYNNTSAAYEPRATYTYDTGADTYSYDTYAFEDRVYYNNNITACSASDAGCTKLYDASGGLSLNLARNGSFEMDAENDNVADGWTVSDATYDEAGSYAAYGVSGYNLDGSDTLTQEGITLQQGVFYALSFYAKDGAAAGAGEAAVTLDFVASDGSAVDFSGYSMDCTLVDDNTVFLAAAALTSSYASVECAFTTPLLDDPTLGLVASLTVGDATDAWVDAVQLEPGSVATDYHDGYNDSTPTEAYLTLPPDWLGCTGNATDPAECDSYAQLCSATDVGCNLYTPVAGGPAVPAVLSSLDLCPEECAGYTTYKQESARYDAEEFPLYFIADTAKSCTEDYVGCDQFTNLETEGIETYTYLRACVTPVMDAGSPYFTWEGSDREGYQLVSWQLLESNLGDAETVSYIGSELNDDFSGLAPCSNWYVDPEDALNCADDATAIAAQTDCDEHDDIFANPDCREFFDASGNVHYRNWSDTVTVADECTAYRKTESNQGDCIASGGFFTASGECRYFGYPAESDACPGASAGCRKYTGGAGRNASTIFDDDVEDGNVSEYETVSATASVSNESVATDGHSMRVAITGAGGRVATLWDGALNSGTLKGLLVADKTYILRFWAKGSGDVSAAFVENGGAGDVDSLGTVALGGSWKLFELGPLDTTSFDSFDDTAVLEWTAASGSVFYLDNIELIQAEENIALIKNSWVTPSTCDISPAGAASPQYYLGCDEYTDPEDATHFIYRFSRLCRGDAVGCQAFYDTQNSVSEYPEIYNLSCYAGTNLGASANVEVSTACAMNGKTVCTIPPGANTCQFDLAGALPVPLPGHIALGPAARVVGNDEIVYAINDGTAECSASAMGCTEVGLPTFSQDRTVVTGFDSAYFLDLPDNYGSTLCEAEALFCEEWSTTQDGNYMFKDPGDQTCEYRTNVNADSSVYSGWFRTGTNEFCYGTGACSGDPAETCETDADCAAAGAGTCSVTDGTYIEGGSVSGVWRNGDAAYDGWAAACGSEYDLCSSFTDPLDTGEGANPDGQIYYYKDNAAIDESNMSSAERCNGQVSLNKGCVLMADGNEVTFSSSSSPSYIASERADRLFGDAPRSLQDPISCPNGGTIDPTVGAEVDLCSQRCAYEVAEDINIINAAVDGPLTGGGVATYFGSSCLDDSDCPVLEDGLRNDIEGTCIDLPTGCPINDATCADPIANGSNYAFANDTNRVLKVYRDRECAEWLACSSAGPATWDEVAGAYKDICDGVDLCTEYAIAGDSDFCSQWKTRDPIALTAEQYSARDTSWYGLEYSGYSIPEQMPVEILDQVNLNPPKVCVNIDGTFSSMACSSKSDCGTGEECGSIEPDYRLAYNAGVCDGNNGSDCEVGFCETSGSACSAADDSTCDATEACITGYCEAVALPTPTDCYDDSDCSGTYDVCKSGICTDIDPDNDGAIDGCSPTVACATGECVPAALTKAGSCYNGLCLLGANGQRFEDVSAEDMTCRGYPEVMSPYPTQIVKTWIEPDQIQDGTPLPTPVSYDAIPYDYVYGFESVSTCSPTGDAISAELSDDCVCSYDKAEYAEGAITRYYPSDTSYSEIPEGICSGGNMAGMACDPVTATVDDSGCGGGGSCMAVTGKNTYLGMLGYCLERDSSIQIFGSNSDKDRACLTWLPVDQLTGATNPYAKAYGAGYQGDTYYCADIEKAYDIQSTEVACAESYKDDCDGDSGWDFFVGKVEADEDCIGSIDCPNGFYAVMTGCGEHLSYIPTGETDWMCKETEDDCPFMCVPKMSYKAGPSDGSADWTQKGDPCLSPDGLVRNNLLPGNMEILETFTVQGNVEKYIDDSDNEITINTPRGVSRSSNSSFKIYLLGATTPDTSSDLTGDSKFDFGDIVAYYDDCTVRGAVENASKFFKPYTSMTLPADINTDDGRRNMQWNYEIYPVCSTVVQVSTTEPQSDGDFNKAWTNRVWPDLGYTLDDPWGGTFEYKASTLVAIFGTSRSPDDMTNSNIVGVDPFPPIPVYCGTAQQESPNIVIPNADNLCPGTMPLSNQNGEDARAYQQVEVTQTQGGSWPDGVVCPGEGSDAACNPGVSCQSGACSGGFLAGFDCSSVADCYYSHCTGTTADTYDESGGLIETTTYACTGGSIAASYSFETEGADKAIARLEQIFAKSYKLYQFKDEYDNVDTVPPLSDWQTPGGFDPPNGMTLDSNDQSGWAWDATETGKSSTGATRPGLIKKPTPPVVASVGECFGTLCLEGEEGTISVNNKSEGNITGEGSAKVIVNFFAWADSDQMPIRGVNVDWGNGDHKSEVDWPTDSQGGSNTGDNYYLNHRGLVDEKSTTTHCDLHSDGGADDEWGFTSGVCDPSYFSFKNAYVCNTGDVDGAGSLPECELNPAYPNQLLNSPCTGGVIADGSGACVFQPRVHVRDNWGWCTGYCDATYGGGEEGCYDKPETIDSEAANECDLSCPGGGNCIDNMGETADPWVYYDGYVIVTPPGTEVTE